MSHLKSVSEVATGRFGFIAMAAIDFVAFSSGDVHAPFFEDQMDIDVEELLRQVTLGQAFDPETIQIMVSAIENAVAQLPLHAGSEYTIRLAKSVMDQAALGERNVQIMQSIALLSIRDVEG